MRALTILFLCTACLEGEPVTATTEPSVSCIEASPTQIDFGTVRSSLGEIERVSRQVVLSNACTAPVQVTNLEVSNETHFAVQRPNTFVVPPGGSRRVVLSFAPTRPGLHSSTVYVDSTADNLPRLQLRAQGELVAPELQLSSTDLDLGEVTVGCQSSYSVTLRNVGNTDASIQTAELLTPSDAEILPGADGLISHSLPYVLPPYSEREQGPQIQVLLDYRPLDELGDIGQVLVSSDDPFLPTRTVHVVGTGVDERLVDEFTLPLSPKVDVLFAMDRSAMMRKRNERIIEAIPTLTDALDRLGVDYHVAAAVGNAGCVVGPHRFIDASFGASAARAAFGAMVDLDFVRAPYGTFENEPFTVAEAALSKKNVGPSGCNEAFNRNDANLSLVLTTDDAAILRSWSYYVALFRSLRPDPEGSRLHAVAGDYPSGCPGADAGVGYYEAVLTTGGQYRSICDTNWVGHHNALAKGSVWHNNRFLLSDSPVPFTIEVRVDGIAVLTGWRFDPGANAVYFEPAAMPGGGSVVEISYASPSNCPE